MVGDYVVRDVDRFGTPSCDIKRAEKRDEQWFSKL
jgi:hypothetical protein